MNLPRPRFTLRRLMVVVAIAGMIAAGIDLERRHKAYGKMADEHTNQEFWWDLEVASRELRLAGIPEYDKVLRKEWIDQTHMAHVVLNYYKKLAHKYRQAALTPWISVGPDPPAPPEPLWLHRHRCE